MTRTTVHARFVAVEKVMVLLRDSERDDEWCARLRGRVADEILNLAVPGLSINVRDEKVRGSLMTLTALNPPVVAVVSLWVRQSYGNQVHDAVALLEKECQNLAAYLVTESTPLVPPSAEL